MTIREAIDKINQHKEWGWTEPTMRALDMGIDALKKQIPKKPLVYTDTRNALDADGNDYGSYQVDCYMCPECGGYLNDVDSGDGYQHCPSCGQAILWEDD